MIALALSPEQAKAIALEIETWTARLHTGPWHIGSIDQYYTLYPVEVYNAHFTNNLTVLFIRDTHTGQMKPANSLTYDAPNYTNMQDLCLKKVKRNLATFFVDVARFVERYTPREGGTSS